jgi:hypothetical protein
MADMKDNMKALDPMNLYETFEKASTAWFDTWSKSPAFLGAMGKTLEAQMGMKSGTDKMVETFCETWKIPTMKDLVALQDQVSELQDRVSTLEEALGEPVAAGASKSETR